ncbi:hypothetical protein QZH41_004061 [Actinostola sp. cb2023]|nr:hypothetical protein QZH41_004061 [Actinostola sp. cb2023]
MIMTKEMKGKGEKGKGEKGKGEKGKGEKEKGEKEKGEKGNGKKKKGEKGNGKKKKGEKGNGKKEKGKIEKGEKGKANGLTKIVWYLLRQTNDGTERMILGENASQDPQRVIEGTIVIPTTEITKSKTLQEIQSRGIEERGLGQRISLAAQRN